MALGGGQPSIAATTTSSSAILSHPRPPRGYNDRHDARNRQKLLPGGLCGARDLYHYGTPMHSYINYGAVIELALNRGVSHLYKRKMIVNDPGDAREFKSMDDVLKALDIVFNDIMDVDEGLVMTQEQVEKEFYPLQLAVRLYGKTALSAACPRNAAAPDTTSAARHLRGIRRCRRLLAAIEKVIFIDKKYTMRQLCDALDADFVGYEDLHKALCDAPKFGSDDDFADKWCRYAHQPVQHVHPEAPQLRGGVLQPGGVSMSVFVPHGAVCGPCPLGRKAGKPRPMASEPSSAPNPTACSPTSTLWARSISTVISIRSGTSASMVDPAARPKAARISPGWSVPSSTRSRPDAVGELPVLRRHAQGSAGT